MRKLNHLDGSHTVTSIPPFFFLSSRSSSRVLPRSKVPDCPTGTSYWRLDPACLVEKSLQCAYTTKHVSASRVPSYATRMCPTQIRGSHAALLVRWVMCCVAARRKNPQCWRITLGAAAARFTPAIFASSYAPVIAHFETQRLSHNTILLPCTKLTLSALVRP